MHLPLRRAGLPFAPTMALTGLLLALAMLLSLLLGYRIYGLDQLWGSFVAFDGSEPHVVIQQYRVPRMVIAPLVGAALGVAGVLVQTLSRNRIASPDTLGLNAGASLAVVVASAGLGISSLLGLSSAAALGALLTTLLVFALAATSGGLSPLRIVLIGVTLAALMHALVEVVLTTQESELDQLIFWLSGSFADRPLTLVWVGAPFVAVGVALAFLVAPGLDTLQTDDATARALGVPLLLIRLASFLAVALLTGASVAMAGPVGFVGLVVPHAARGLVGLRHVRLLAAAAVLGALYATAADVLARFVIYPREAPVGAITAVVGGCVLLVLLKRRAA
jgi:iron complex transport system permease protein